MKKKPNPEKVPAGSFTLVKDDPRIFRPLYVVSRSSRTRIIKCQFNKNDHEVSFFWWAKNSYWFFDNYWYAWAHTQRGVRKT